MKRLIDIIAHMVHGSEHTLLSLIRATPSLFEEVVAIIAMQVGFISTTSMEVITIPIRSV